MRNLLTTLVAAMMLALLAAPGSAQQPDLRTIMKAKLGHAQAVLEGLAMENFDKIGKGAQGLATMGRADAWIVSKSPDYMKFILDFQAVSDSMVANAKARKLEAVTLDYVQMTMLCVKCHSYARKAGIAGDFGGAPTHVALRAPLLGGHE